jgi:hypothetical protein
LDDPAADRSLAVGDVVTGRYSAPAASFVNQSSICCSVMIPAWLPTTSPAASKHRRGHAKDLEVPHWGVVHGVHGRVGDVEVFQQPRPLLVGAEPGEPADVDADQQHAVGMLFVRRLEPRHLGPAGRTLRGPVVEDDRRPVTEQ